jgi:diaminopimelate epimerase
VKLKFTKMSGAGNDFIVLGPEYGPLKGELSQLARRMCPRRTSVGADGLILVEKTGPDLYMHYFNSDGSEASFCGNGARCLVRYCLAKGIAKGPVRFRSGSGMHAGDVGPLGVRVDMRMPALIREVDLRVRGDSAGGQRHVFLVDAGVPHAVTLAGSVEELDVEVLGREIRRHPDFEPEGANVDFVDSEGDAPFVLRTYERGVEKETLACGSGCVAAALVLRHRRLAGDTVALKVASGDIVTVEFSSGQAFLVGPAAIVYDGEIELAATGAKEMDHV